MKFVLISLINFYQILVSPFLGSHCRHEPSCSEYAKTSIAKKGFIKGLFLSCVRLLSCHPFSKKNYFDPVK